MSSEAELYDVAADPAETRNLAASTSGVVQQLTTALRKREKSAGTAPSGAVSPEAAERLRSLGYVGGATQSVPDADAPNPAKVIDGWRQFERALALVNTGRARDALPALQALATRFPSGPVFQIYICAGADGEREGRDRIGAVSGRRWRAGRMTR